MTVTLVVAAILFIFGTFAAAVTYAQVQTHGLVAPGARSID